MCVQPEYFFDYSTRTDVELVEYIPYVTPEAPTKAPPVDDATTVESLDVDESFTIDSGSSTDEDSFKNLQNIQPQEQETVLEKI